MQKPELTAPAGSLEKLKVAVAYGADALYLGGLDFSLRKRAANFSRSEMASGVEYAHSHGVRVYVAVNIFALSDDFNELPSYLEFLAGIRVDAVIVSDPGIIRLIRRMGLPLKVHLSTQMNVTNHESVAFWAEQGVERIVLARELSFSQIAFIREHSSVELEIFAHGALCLSYSGRCYMSQYMVDRSANRGDCAQSCRWHYTLVEDKRPNQYYEVEEDERGAYFLNSFDLCLLGRLRELLDLNLTAWKIEGRVKGIFYLGMVIKAYREARDCLIDDPEAFEERLPLWLADLNKISHRPYLDDLLKGAGTAVENRNTIRDHLFLAIVNEMLDNNTYRLTARNQLREGMEVEVLSPDGEPGQLRLDSLRNLDGQPVALVQPNAGFLLQTEKKLPQWSMLHIPCAR